MKHHRWPGYYSLNTHDEEWQECPDCHVVQVRARIGERGGVRVRYHRRCDPTLLRKAPPCEPRKEK